MFIIYSTNLHKLPFYTAGTFIAEIQQPKGFRERLKIRPLNMASPNCL